MLEFRYIYEIVSYTGHLEYQARRRDLCDMDLGMTQAMILQKARQAAIAHERMVYVRDMDTNILVAKYDHLGNLDTERSHGGTA